jgi:hypothetical protein
MYNFIPTETLITMQHEHKQQNLKAGRTIERQGSQGKALPAVPVLQPKLNVEKPTDSLAGALNVVQRVLAQSQRLSVTKAADYKRGIGTELYDEIINSSLTTAAEVNLLFEQLDEVYPWEAIAIAQSINARLSKDIQKKVTAAKPKLKATIMTLIAAIKGPAPTDSSSSSSSPSPSSSSSSSPSPSSSSSSTPPASSSAWATSTPAPGVSLFTSASPTPTVAPNPEVTSGEIRSGTTEHGTFKQGALSISRGEIVEHVKKNNWKAELDKGNYSLKLGISDDHKEWFVTYKIFDKKAVINHFGPFGAVTGGGIA